MMSYSVCMQSITRKVWPIIHLPTWLSTWALSYQGGDMQARKKDDEMAPPMPCA